MKTTEPALDVPSDLISVSAAGALVGLSHWAIRRRISTGQLRGFRFDARTLRVSKREVLSLVSAVPAAASR